MKNIVKNVTDYVTLLSFLAVVVGILLLVDPGLSLMALGIIVGAYLIVQGIMLIFLDIKAWRMFIPFEGMLKGILSVVLGVLIFRNPDSIAAYIGIVLGIYIIVYGFSGIKFAVAIRHTGAPWILMVIINIVYIVFGCLVLYTPVFSALSLTVYVGVILIAYSLVNIVYMFAIKKHAKEIETLIAEKKAFGKGEAAAEPEAEAESEAE